MEETIKIAISGSYGGFNLGDEAILQSIITQIKDSSSSFHITVLTHDSEDTLIRHNVDKVLVTHKMSQTEVREEIKKLDVFVLGGGGLLYDEMVEYYLRHAEMAIEAGIPVFVYAISAGPLIRPSNRKLVARVLDHVYKITVRDHYAKKLLEEISVQKEILVTADPAVLLKPEELPKDALLQEGLISKKRLIAL